MTEPCSRCGRTDYDRKTKIQLEGERVAVCNLCAPEEISVPVEVRTGAHTISTGMLKARLDWQRIQPVVEVESKMNPIPWWRQLWEQFLGLFKRSKSV
jgi:ribosome-binding protein aMBF1 (putative translation factor)